MASGQARPQPVGVICQMSRREQQATTVPTLPATFGPVGPASVAELAQAMGPAGPPAAQQRLDTGRRCYAAWVPGGLAAYGWVSLSDEEVSELGLRVRLLPDEAYIWDCVTLPAYRRRGLYAALLGYITRTLRAEGVGTFWIGADANNKPSLAGFARAGFKAVADLVADPPQPGQRRQRAWLEARPGIGPELLAEARRAYLDSCDEVWLFD